MTVSSNMPESVRQGLLDEIKAQADSFAAQQSSETYPGFEAENLTDSERQLHHFMFDSIILPGWAHDTDPLSATPGDPYSVMNEEFEAYYSPAFEYMMAILDHARDQYGLTDEQYKIIKAEIRAQHDVQCNHNNESISRLHALFYREKGRFDAEIAERVRNVRAGSATSLDRVLLLKDFPEVDSIEDMKFTSPLDHDGHMTAKVSYAKQLMEFNGNQEAGFIVQMVPEQEQEVRPKKVSDADGEKIKVVKVVIAKIYFADSDTVIEVVEKRSFYDFTNEENLHTLPKGAPLQPISVSAYLRVERDRSETGDELPLIFDSTKMPVIKSNGVVKNSQSPM